MELNAKWKFEIKDLPDMDSMIHEANQIASSVEIGQTLFMKEHGVRSEREYKEKMAKEHKVMKHSAIGWNSWDATEEGITRIYETLKKEGSYIDRFGACMDWVMGVPENLRHKFQAGSSLILKNEDEWMRLGQFVPVQPHLGDHMIGSLNSIENTVLGLKAGITTIGNISHYYTYEYPGMESMEKQRTSDMVKAIVIMGHFRDQGTIIHSNLDDGFGAQFHDLANLCGYAIMERYICEELLGARMGHCFGNLFNDPILRIIFNVAMEKINTYHTPGSMIYGNTIDFTYNMPGNFSALCGYGIADAAGQVLFPSGHAITPIPVTEAIRVPSVDEIIEAHLAMDMAIRQSDYYIEFLDVPKIQAKADVLVACGRIFFERMLNALDGLGVDINHAGEVLAALKAIGVEQLETNFGAGQLNKEAQRGRTPICETSIMKDISKKQTSIMSKIDNFESVPLSGKKIVVGSTDVHEFGKNICKNVLEKAGAEVFDLGSTIAIEDLADTVIETGCDAIVVSTYNGIALSFAKDMLRKFDEMGIHVEIIMGGRLNENVDGSDLPEDVTGQLSELGINTDNQIETMVDYLTKTIVKKSA